MSGIDQGRARSQRESAAVGSDEDKWFLLSRADPGSIGGIFSCGAAATVED